MGHVAVGSAGLAHTPCLQQLLVVAHNILVAEMLGQPLLVMRSSRGRGGARGATLVALLQCQLKFRNVRVLPGGPWGDFHRLQVLPDPFDGHGGRGIRLSSRSKSPSIAF